jgi:hypothetical protein
MVTCQLLMAAMAAIKRFDSLVLHMRSSMLQALRSMLWWKTNDEAEY